MRLVKGGQKYSLGVVYKSSKCRIKEPGLCANIKRPFKDVKAGID